MKNGYPLPNETCVVTSARMYKRGALLFDRIWVPKKCLKLEKLAGIPPEITYEIEESVNEINSIMNNLGEKLWGELLDDDEMTADDYLKNLGINYIRTVTECDSKHGINVTCLFDSEKSFAHDYPDGNSLVYQAALKNIDLIAEDNINWNQVLEFRDLGSHLDY